MATETQKNFKKQMAEIQKNMNSKTQDQYFSYIENDHIESYYKPKKNRKRIATISIGSILPLLFLCYSMYTWFRPLVSNTPNIQTTPINSVAIGGNPIFSSKHSKIAEYLNSIRIYDEQVKIILDYIHKNFNAALTNKENKVAFTENISKYKADTENYVLLLSNIKYPEDMQEYHNIIKQKYDTVFEEVIYASETMKTGNTTNISHLNYLSEKYNLLAKQQTQQMLSAFDKVGIKYQQNGNNIQYWYNK